MSKITAAELRELRSPVRLVKETPNRKQKRHPPKGFYWCEEHQTFHSKNPKVK